METAWWHQPDRRGEGILIFVDRDGSTAGTFYLPGRWYFLADFVVNPFTRAIDFAIGRQDTLGADLVRVGSGSIRHQPDGSAQFSWTIDGQVSGGTFVKLMPAPINQPPFPPPPPPPEPPVEPLPPIVPAPPVIPPGVALNPVVRTWAQLFGGEFGQSGWRLDPPFALHNSPSGLCDVLCIAFRAPAADSGFNYGRFTQNPDAGSILQWFSHAPADLSVARSYDKAWTVGDLAWSLAGTPGHPTQSRFKLEPGEVYYLNAAFVSGALITDNRLEPTSSGGQFALTATQLS